MLRLSTNKLSSKSATLGNLIAFSWKAFLVYILFCTFSYTESWASTEGLKRIFSSLPGIGGFFSPEHTSRNTKGSSSVALAAKTTSSLTQMTTAAASHIQKQIQVFENTKKFDFSFDFPLAPKMMSRSLSSASSTPFLDFDGDSHFFDLSSSAFPSWNSNEPGALFLLDHLSAKSVHSLLERGEESRKESVLTSSQEVSDSFQEASHPTHESVEVVNVPILRHSNLPSASDSSVASLSLAALPSSRSDAFAIDRPIQPSTSQGSLFNQPRELGSSISSKGYKATSLTGKTRKKLSFVAPFRLSFANLKIPVAVTSIGLPSSSSLESSEHIRESSPTPSQKPNTPFHTQQRKPKRQKRVNDQTRDVGVTSIQEHTTENVTTDTQTEMPSPLSFAELSEPMQVTYHNALRPSFSGRVIASHIPSSLRTLTHVAAPEFSQAEVVILPSTLAPPSDSELAMMQPKPETFCELSELPFSQAISSTVLPALELSTATLVQVLRLASPAQRFVGHTLSSALVLPQEEESQIHPREFAIDNSALVELINGYKFIQLSLNPVRSLIRDKIIALGPRNRQNAQAVARLTQTSEEEDTSYASTSKRLVNTIRSLNARIVDNQQERIQFASSVDQSIGSLRPFLRQQVTQATNSLSAAREVLTAAEPEEDTIYRAFRERHNTHKETIRGLKQRGKILLKQKVSQMNGSLLAARESLAVAERQENQIRSSIRALTEQRDSLIDSVREERVDIGNQLQPLRRKIHEFIMLCLTSSIERAGRTVTEDLRVDAVAQTIVNDLDTTSDDDMADVLSQLYEESGLSLEAMGTGASNIGDFRTLTQRLQTIDQQIDELNTHIQNKENEAGVLATRCTQKSEDVNNAESTLTTLRTLSREWPQDDILLEEENVAENVVLEPPVEEVSLEEVEREINRLKAQIQDTKDEIARDINATEANTTAAAIRCAQVRERVNDADRRLRLLTGLLQDCNQDFSFDNATESTAVGSITCLRHVLASGEQIFGETSGSHDFRQQKKAIEAQVETLADNLTRGATLKETRVAKQKEVDTLNTNNRLMCQHRNNQTTSLQQERNDLD